jgi:undecaprenyl diphosphate synthase
VQRTAANTRLNLTICANYGGRWDIAQAASAAAELLRSRGGRIALSEADLAPHLALAFAPEPDLLIRTGGERRISNFLLWQLAYTELYFCDTLWPDFDAAELDRALDWFSKRERRFGMTGEQVAAKPIADAA